MPSEYLVGHIDNAQTIDLSKLATSSASNELIDCGDLLTVTIDSGYEADRENPPVTVRVGEDGNAVIPLVGGVAVAGMELTAAEQVIRVAAVERGVYRNPIVTLEMKQPRVNRVTVLGAVTTPGTYELPRASSSLLAAIIKAEGLSPEAGTEIEIRRPALRSEAVPSGPDINLAGEGPQLAGYAQPHATLRPSSSTRINLISATQEVGGKREYYLDDGDVVMVEKRDPLPVHVIGLVGQARPDPSAGQSGHAPARRHRPGRRRLDSLRQQEFTSCGGCRASDSRWSSRSACATRRRRAGGIFSLGPGDVVSVEQSAPNFAMDMFKTVIPYAISPTLTATLLR